jgi:hypothetical protein
VTSMPVAIAKGGAAIENQLRAIRSKPTPTITTAPTWVTSGPKSVLLPKITRQEAGGGGAEHSGQRASSGIPIRE